MVRARSGCKGWCFHERKLQRQRNPKHEWSIPAVWREKEKKHKHIVVHLKATITFHDLAIFFFYCV
jgi:hypothetical protein